MDGVGTAAPEALLSGSPNSSAEPKAYGMCLGRDPNLCWHQLPFTYSCRWVRVLHPLKQSEELSLIWALHPFSSAFLLSLALQQQEASCCRIAPKSKCFWAWRWERGEQGVQVMGTGSLADGKGLDSRCSCLLAWP